MHPLYSKILTESLVKCDEYQLNYTTSTDIKRNIGNGIIRLLRLIIFSDTKHSGNQRNIGSTTLYTSTMYGFVSSFWTLADLETTLTSCNSNRHM